MFCNTLNENNVLSKAMQNKEFALHYQPIVGSAFNILWFEVLMRWNNPALEWCLQKYYIKETNSLYNKIKN